MSTEQLTQQAVSLPLPERVLLAEALWESIDEELAARAPDEERAVIDEAMRRGEELRQGIVAGLTHEQVMDAARRSIGR